MMDSRMHQELDILIKDGLILTLEPEVAPVPRGYIAIRGATITDIGSMSHLEAGVRAKKIINANGCLVMPGLVNAHTHLPMSVFRGLADDLPLDTWLNEHIFPAEAAHVNEDLVYWGSKLALAEMLLTGTTCIGDGYFYEEHAARAVQETGLRAVLGQGVIDFPAPGAPDPAESVTIARNFIERWQGVSDLIKPSVFCHSPYTCSSSTLNRSKDLAREMGVLLQIHVAETENEVKQSLVETGLTPIRFLDSLDLLDECTLAVHCVHLDDEEIDLLASKKVPVVVCPESHMKLASGLARLPEMLDKGVCVALGTDGAASNNDLNLFSEIRSAALIQKAAAQDPTTLPATQILRTATSGGAQALNSSSQFGTLTAGSQADLIMLNLNHPNLKPMYNPFSHLVYAASGREVRTVLVGGRILVEDGQLTTLDLDEIMERVREIAKKIKR
ncbi:MAG: amidohydrolase [Deltaproteobacteria bacterium]|nr:amidohydrolase [Deltaproteobacteria bacterium]